MIFLVKFASLVYDMSCYKPLHAFPVGFTADGKKSYKVFGRSVDSIRFNGRSFTACDSRCSDAITEYIDIPCRKCIGCRLDYSRQWADRLMIELQRHDSAWFVTLTYDENNVPHAVRPSTGEIEPYSTLIKRDCQLFMKRLRKAHQKLYPDNHLMYYLAGEYGEISGRPHYHAIIFDLVLNDLKLWSRVNGFQYFTSEWLQSIWKLGRVIVAHVTWDTCAYTARYIVKKQLGKAAKEEYYENGILPEFSLVSTKPAISKIYFEESILQSKIFGNVESLHLSTSEGGREVRFPKYWDRLYERIDPDGLSEIKDSRKEAAESIKQLKLVQTSKSYYDYLEDEELNKLAQVNVLKRRYV